MWRVIRWVEENHIATSEPELTSTSRAVRAVAVCADLALAHNRTVDVLSAVGRDVACAAAAVGYLGCGHG
jgi:hypothetical protein